MEKINRILKYVEDEGLSVSQFERITGLSYSYLGKTADRGAEITQKNLKKIKDNAPLHYYKIFPEEQPEETKVEEHEAPYNVKEVERLRTENELLRNQLRMIEKLDTAIDVMQQHSTDLKGMNQTLRAIEQQQIVSSAIDIQYQEYVIGKLDSQANPEATVQALQRKGFEKLTNIRIADTAIAQGNQHSTAT